MPSAAALIDELKRYVRFGAVDEKALHALRQHARPRFADIAREFYERSREHEEAHAVFQNEAQMGRLHESLIRWLERMLSGPWDARYAEQSLRIGAVHDRVGLPQRYMFTGMALFRVRLVEIAAAQLGERAIAACHALARVLDMELAMMNESYREAMIARLQRLESERNELALASSARLQRLESERNELALASSALRERRYADVVALAGAVIIGLDGQGQVRVFNREAERVTGYAFDEVAGKRFRELLLAEDDAAFDATWQRALGAVDDVPLPASCTLRTRSGKHRELAARLSRTGGDDESRIFVLAGRDITEDKAMEARLRQSEKLAAVGTLAAGLAHEIRNPLNGAQLHLTFLERALKKKGPDPEVLEAAQVVAAEIRRLSSLVTEFLYFARPGELRRQPTSVQTLCRKAAGMLLVEAQRVALALELPESDLVAEIDADRVQQVLLNLLQNAAEAVGGQGGHITLRAYRKPRHAVLEVHDDGPGISSPDAPIFDAFYSTKPGGTGLGLAIAHRIVTDHAGTIQVESRPGSTTFRVTLPLRDPEHPSSISRPPIVQEKKP